ncbi:MAG: hypothetical protein HDS75_07855, partial [Bacteroidales bacterium]|nr:hypothetical protein [Bacteroidales bacterium]
DITIKEITTLRQNPVYKEYNQAINFAKLLLNRYSYDITKIGNKEISTPPFWIDMSKLFELYIYKRLKQIFTFKGEVVYHHKSNKQELDYLLNAKGWSEPYVIDAKYKPRYSREAITLEDARQVSGYARLSSIYRRFELNENMAPPIKCLIIYPDQDADEVFNFTGLSEPTFDTFREYVRIYKMGIRLPVIELKDSC